MPISKEEEPVNKRESSAYLVSLNEQVFICPLCKAPMKVNELRSVICKNHHTFDFAKQGYVNMMTRPTKSIYKKELFEARHKMITGSHIYSPLHKQISKIMLEQLLHCTGQKFVLDAGCGEGSHLQRVLDVSANHEITGVGLDISKEGVAMAAKNYRSALWIVGDIAHAPIADQSCHAVLNILSPANYSEFKRIMAPNGLIVKVVPGVHYLKELRGFRPDDKQYTNKETVSLFQEHFQLVEHIKLNYTIELAETDLINLVKMTPLGWNIGDEWTAYWEKLSFFHVTIELEIMVGVK